MDIATEFRKVTGKSPEPGTVSKSPQSGRDEAVSEQDKAAPSQDDPKRQLIDRLRSTYADEIATFPFFGDMVRELEEDIERLSLGQIRRKVKRVNKLAAQAKWNRGDDACWYCGQLHRGYTCPVWEVDQ